MIKVCYEKIAKSFVKYNIYTLTLNFVRDILNIEYLSVVNKEQLLLPNIEKIMKKKCPLIVKIFMKKCAKNNKLLKYTTLYNINICFDTII